MPGMQAIAASTMLIKPVILYMLFACVPRVQAKKNVRAILHMVLPVMLLSAWTVVLSMGVFLKHLWHPDSHQRDWLLYCGPVATFVLCAMVRDACAGVLHAFPPVFCLLWPFADAIPSYPHP